MMSNDNKLLRNCTRFKYKLPEQFPNIDFQNAVLYANLRKNSCPMKNAIGFCNKTICKSDTTKALDGPSKYQKLRVKPEKYMSTTINVNLYKYETKDIKIGLERK